MKTISRAKQSAKMDAPALVRGLTARRRELIRPVLEDPRPYVLLSLRATAKELGSDPATLSRIVQAMGFACYRDFQHYLHDRSIAFSTSFEAWMEHSSVTGTPDLVRRSIERDLQNIQQFHSGLDTDRLVAVAKRLYSARRVLVLAGDVVSSVAHYLQYNLAMLGLNVVGAFTPGEIVHRVRHAGRQDVAIAVTYGRGLRQTVEGLKVAHEHGVYCIGIGDAFISPLISFSDQFFLTPTDRVSFADSYVAGMSLCNALLVVCANIQRHRTFTSLKKAEEEQRHGYRWYNERETMHSR